MKYSSEYKVYNKSQGGENRNWRLRNQRAEELCGDLKPHHCSLLDNIAYILFLFFFFFPIYEMDRLIRCYSIIPTPPACLPWKGKLFSHLLFPCSPSSCMILPLLCLFCISPDFMDRKELRDEQLPIPRCIPKSFNEFGNVKPCKNQK